MKEKVVIGLFVIVLFVSMLSSIVDIDFPFHLKTGEFIYENKAIPVDDPFSPEQDRVWSERRIFQLSQYWLAQVLFYKIYDISGPAGTVIFKAIIFSLFLFMVWFTIRKRGLYSSILITILAAIAILPNVLDRPQYFSFLFTVLVIFLLQKFKDDTKSFLWLFIIPPIMLLWANLHGGFVFGLAILILYSMLESVKFFAHKIKPELPMGQPLPEKSLLILLVVCFLSIQFSYLNPNSSLALLITMQSHTTDKWVVDMIREYASPYDEIKSSLSKKLFITCFWVLLGIVWILVCLDIVRKKSVDITVFVLVVFSSVIALSALRYIPFFIGTAIPLTKDYRFFERFDFLKDKRKRAFIFLVFVIFFVYIIFGFKNYKGVFRVGSSEFYAQKATEFLLKNDIDANIFTSNNIGSYLIWKLYPHYRVFSDSRYTDLEEYKEGLIIRFAMTDRLESPLNVVAESLAELVPPDVGKIKISTDSKYVKTQRKDKPEWKALLDKYKIDLIVHEATSTFEAHLFPFILKFLNDDDWVLIYLDGKTLIFIKNDKKYSEIIQKYRKPKDLIYDEIILEAMPHIKNRTTSSSAYSSVALALTMKGHKEDAKKMIDASLELNKMDMVANFCLAYLSLMENKKLSKK